MYSKMKENCNIYDKHWLIMTKKCEYIVKNIEMKQEESGIPFFSYDFYKVENHVDVAVHFGLY